MDHLHVDYLLEEGMKDVEDPDIKALMKSNASTRHKKEARVSPQRSI